MQFNRSLDNLFDEFWSDLDQAAGDNQHPWRWPVVATVTPDGLPAARTVVLRRADRERRMLVFHSDARSRKVDHLRENARVSWCFWNAEKSVQLRVSAGVRLHTGDDFAQREWESQHVGARQVYMVRNHPGRVLNGPETGLPPELESRKPTEEESEAGRSHFLAVETIADHIDWLHISKSGHLRALFDHVSGSWNSQWIQA